jgi:hypothetical protein
MASSCAAPAAAGAGRSAGVASLAALVIAGGGRSTGGAGSFDTVEVTLCGPSETCSVAAVDCGAFSVGLSSISGRARTDGRVPLSPLGRAGAYEARGGALGRETVARVALGGAVSESTLLGVGVLERDFLSDASTAFVAGAAERELGTLEVNERELGAVELDGSALDAFAIVGLAFGSRAGLEGINGFAPDELLALAPLSVAGVAVVAALT